MNISDHRLIKIKIAVDRKINSEVINKDVKLGYVREFY